MSLESWLLFSSIALVATITPGPAVLLVTSHSIGRGCNWAVFTILGNITGLFCMSLLSVLGLGAVVLYSANGFFLIKIFGACYLIYLGIKLWRHGLIPTTDAPVAGHQHLHGSRFKLYSQGLMVALSNPKAIAFTTALFPQFIDHSRPLTGQFLVLVATFMAYSFICLYIYAKLGASTIRLQQNKGKIRVVSRIFATLLIGSGVGLGVSS